MLAVRDKRDNAQRISTGQLWQRLHLWATTHGLAMQPLNQMTEMADREVVLSSTPRFGNGLSTLIADPTWQEIFTFRVGYATHLALLNPRRALTDVVIA